MADEDNGLRVWPVNWPRHYNACSGPCDMLAGPCACGAWHQVGEFMLRSDGLYRRGFWDQYGFAFYRKVAEA